MIGGRRARRAMTIAIAAARLHEHVADHAAHHASDKSTEKGVACAGRRWAECRECNGRARRQKYARSRWVLYRLDAHGTLPMMRFSPIHSIEPLSDDFN